MPIRTIHNGVLVLGVAVMVSLAAGFVDANVASAAPARTAKTYKKAQQVSRTRTTKRVRTKTAYSNRRYRAATASAARSVALPREVSGSEAGQSVAQRAKQFVGYRYRWGGSSPSTGFDCSGLVHHVLGDNARNLPRSAAGMYSAVSKTGEIQPGDIVFFGRGRIRHAGIYTGNGQVVHASTPRTGVRTDSLASLARSLGYAGAGRAI